MTAEFPKRVLITGAAGRIGRLLQQHLGRTASYQLVLLDRTEKASSEVHAADLSRLDPSWTKLFKGADTILHLAGDARPLAPWASLEANNINGTLNVFRAAVKYNAKRVIFASSMQTMEGYRYTGSPVPAGAPPRPVSFYGASKRMGETTARYFAEEHGISVICLRIGNAQIDSTPPQRTWHRWAHFKWLSADDLCQAMEKAILAEDIDFAVLPLVSDNDGMPWDLSETRRVLGYAPAHGTSKHTPPLSVRLKQTMAWTYRKLFDVNWRDYWD